jgi:hypothetical protein
MDGVVSLQQAGCVLQLHDTRIDHVTVAQSTGDIATATVRGNVSFWSDRLFREKAKEAGLLQPAEVQQAQQDDADMRHGNSIFMVTKGQVCCCDVPL